MHRLLALAALCLLACRTARPALPVSRDAAATVQVEPPASVGVRTVSTSRASASGGATAPASSAVSAGSSAPAGSAARVRPAAPASSTVSAGSTAPTRSAAPSRSAARPRSVAPAGPTAPSRSVEGAEGIRARRGLARAPAKAEGPDAARIRRAVRARPADAVVRRVAPLVGRSSLQGEVRALPDDCTGLVRHGYRAAGVELLVGGQRGENAVTSIHRHAQGVGALHRRTPRAGDLVFFRETYDRNGDGARNDGLTHVGIVESVGRDGTVTFIHRSNTGVQRSRLNLRLPHARRAKDGTVLNDGMRRAAPGARGLLAGELFAGYASAEVLLPREAPSLAEAGKGDPRASARPARGRR
jgi:CHAP domain